MKERSADDDLFPEIQNPPDLRIINSRCLIRTHDNSRLVIASGVVLAQYALGDRTAEAVAMMNLVAQGLATQIEVARAFDWSTRTLRRQQQRFENEGWSGLVRAKGYPRGRPRLANNRSQVIHQLKAGGHSQREIARRLGVTEKAIRKVLRRLGWKSSSPIQPQLPLENASHTGRPPVDPKAAVASRLGADPNLSAFDKTQAPLCTADRDPANRWSDRLLARLGLLDDAPPLFGSGTDIPRAGVLLAVPPLVASGIFDCAKKVYGSLGPPFFGLRTTFVTLLLMALWRIRRAEGLKEHSPATLGRVLGLDRAPEVKTLRRKLARLATTGRAVEFGRALAQQRIAQHGKALGFLYVDGHVRVYHGKQHPSTYCYG